MLIKIKFKKYEKRIHAQLNMIGIPSKSELVYENQGKIFVWHTIGDGHVSDNCESMEGKIFKNMEDIPDDLHPNCRCLTEEINLKSV